MRSQEQCSMGMSDLCSLWPAGRAFRSQLQVLFSFLDESIVFNDFRIFFGGQFIVIICHAFDIKGHRSHIFQDSWLHPNSFNLEVPNPWCTLKSSILFSDFPWNNYPAMGVPPWIGTHHLFCEFSWWDRTGLPGFWSMWMISRCSFGPGSAAWCLA